MTVSSANEYPVPAGAASLFTDGEMALSPGTSSVSTPGNTTWWLSRWINLPAGTYTLKLAADDTCTAWVGTAQVSSRRVATSTPSTAITGDFFVHAGRQRLDLVLTNLSAGVSDCWAALSIWRNGKLVYASSAAGWVMDSAAIADASLPAVGDVRLTLPVWTISPNWADGVTERLEFLTEILTSEAGTEQRRTTRQFPRRSFEMAFMRAGADRSRMDTFITAVGNGEFLAPLWHDQQRLRVPLTIANTTVQFDAGDLIHREFFPGDLALLSNGDPAVHEVVGVLARDAGADLLTLAAPPTINWPAGTRLVPLRRAMFRDMPSISNATERVGMLSARFELTQPEMNIAPSWGYCAPLWRFKVDRAEPVALDYGRTTFELDVGTGPVLVVDPGERTRIGTSARLRLRGRGAVATYRSFMMQARGRAQRFWAPSMLQDIVPQGDLSGLTFDAEPTGFSEWMLGPQEARVMLAVVFNDGAPPLYRTLVDVTPIGATVPPFRPTTDRFTVDTPFPPISAGRIARVQWVVPSRFDQDSFELQHTTAGCTAVGAAVVLRSVDAAGMEGIDCWVTSQVYPVHVPDGLQMSALVTGGSFGMTPAPLDALQMSALVTGGTLQSLQLSTSIAPEALQMSALVTDGSFPINVVYRQTDIAPEALQMSAALLDGALQTVLITQTMGVEALQMSATVLSGTLS